MHTLEAKKCETCGTIFDKTILFCPHDGQKLIMVDTMIGQTLDGRYRIEGLLGRGGMGVVYRAKHVHLDNQCAIKVLNPELVSNQSAIERFRREAKAAGRIQHPNAIQVTDFGVTADNLVYLVMEIVNGDTLREVLQKETRLSYRRTVNLMQQVCAAVEAAHQSGVIHRDLKPDNIVLKNTPAGEQVKVLDFGIAKLKEREPTGGLAAEAEPAPETLTATGTIIGTPQYMSPEQCRARKLDARSDVYSLGVILYEMLTGQLPFTADTAIEIVVKHLKENPRPLCALYPAVPAAIERVVLRALEKNPEQRQSSAAELAAELAQAVLRAEQPLDQSAQLASADTRANEFAHQATLLQTDLRPGALPTVLMGEGGAETEESAARKTQAATVLNTAPRPQYVKQRPAPAPAPAPAMPEQKKPSAGWKLPAVVLAAVLLAVIGYVIYRANTGTINNQQTNNGGNTEVATPEGMVLIPGGKFVMGRADGDEDERPVHEVTVKSFYLDKYEVTNQQYKAFVDATGQPAPRHWKNNGSYAPAEARLPITYVSWTEAAAYARWAQKRLPTEAEWEYAARGGDKQLLYPWGNEWQEGYANANRATDKKLAPVGSYETDVSPFGVFDLSGNVSEWVQDFLKSYAGGQADEQYKVFRGGNWYESPDPTRSTATYRWYDLPVPADINKLAKIGFRCAKDAP